MSQDDDALGDIFHFPVNVSSDVLNTVNVINPEVESNLDPSMTDPLFFDPNDAIIAVRDIEPQFPTLLFGPLDEELLKIVRYKIPASHYYHKSFSQHLAAVQTSYAEQLPHWRNELENMKRDGLLAARRLRQFAVRNWGELNKIFPRAALRPLLDLDFVVIESNTYARRLEIEFEEDHGETIRRINRMRKVRSAWTETWDLLSALKLQEKDILRSCGSIKRLEFQKNRIKNTCGELVLPIYEKAWNSAETMSALDFFDIRP